MTRRQVVLESEVDEALMLRFKKKGDISRIINKALRKELGLEKD